MGVKFVLRQYAKMGVQNFFLPLVYRICRRRGVNRKRVIFADAHHEDVPFSMRCLLEEVRKTDLEVVTMFSDYGKNSFLENLRQMVRFMRAYANAGYVVLCDNFLPAASCRKRKETTVIQLWHACGALKKFGRDASDDVPAYYRGNVQKNCDYVTVSSARCVPYFASAMELPEARILPVGVSRTDLYRRAGFLEEARARFRRLYPLAEGKKVILWAPTFRGNAAHPQLCGEDAVDRLAQKLGEGFFVLKAPHPHLRRGGETGGMATEELLAATDLLITDYSSILFDYMLFQKPLVRFAPDLAQYEERRGFYMDYRSLPGALVTDGGMLYDAVCRELAHFDAGALARTAQTYMDACDGDATGRILHIMEG